MKRLELLDLALDRLRKAMSAEDIVKLGHEIIQDAIQIEKTEKRNAQAALDRKNEENFTKLKELFDQTDFTTEDIQALLSVFGPSRW